MNLAALVLAAGAGRRFAQHSGTGKLAATFRGEPLLHHALRAALAAPVSRVVVIAAPQLDCEALPERAEVLRLASDSLSASLCAGLAALEGADGVFVFLGDMPLVPHDLAARLAGLLPGHYAVVPRFGDQPGHPVLLSRAAMADGLNPEHPGHLQGDEGAGRLLRGRSDVAFLGVSEEGAVLDIDRAEDLARLEGL